MQKLAESFALNSDILLRHRVVELYSSGLDGLAEEVPLDFLYSLYICSLHLALADAAQLSN